MERALDEPFRVVPVKFERERQRNNLFREPFLVELTHRQ